jgi:hypothetical protein
MAYKTFIAGEQALASDVNAYLMSQTIARFANASNRASLLPSPSYNQLSMLDDRAGNIQYWNGSSWVDFAPQLTAGYWIQFGTNVVTTNAGGGSSIVFGTSFSGSPVVIATPGDNGTPFFINQIVGQLYPNNFGFQCFKNGSGTPEVLANASVRVNWYAIGTR